METKFFVMECYRYAESKNWEYSLKGMYDSLDEAKQIFHARLGAIMKKTNDFAMAIYFDSFGNRIDADYSDTHVEEVPADTVIE